MTNLTLAIANHANSNARDLDQVEVPVGTTVREALNIADVSVGSGQTVSLNGVDVSLDDAINTSGLLAITGEAKAA